MVVGSLPWDYYKRKVNKTIRELYKSGTPYVSAQYIAEEMYEKKTFPYDVTYRTALKRVTTVLKEHHKWEIRANRPKGQIFTVPKWWWDNGNNKSKTKTT